MSVLVFRDQRDLPIVGAPVSLSVLVLSVEHHRDDCQHWLQEDKLQSTTFAHAHKGAIDRQRWHAAGAVQPGWVHHIAIHFHLFPVSHSSLSAMMLKCRQYAPARIAVPCI